MNVAPEYYNYKSRLSLPDCVSIVDLKMTSWSLTQSVQVEEKVFVPSANFALNLGSRGLPIASVILLKGQEEISVNMIVTVKGVTMVNSNTNDKKEEENDDYVDCVAI
jgi:hypothetical protein